MSQRLYLHPEQVASDERVIELTREQVHYLGRVLRLKTNASLLCFNGGGVEWRSRILALDGRTGRIELEAIQREQPPVRTALTLAISWLKGAAMDTVVQKATELGVDILQVLYTERSNVTLDARRTGNKLRHWQQIAISAAEQSNRLYLPEVLPPVSLTELLQQPGESRLLMLDLDAPILEVGTQPQALTMLVGPEGGWSDAERQLAEQKGVERAGLGNLILRAETAPLAALAVVQHCWGWQR